MPESNDKPRVSWVARGVIFLVVCALSAGAALYVLRDRIEVSSGRVKLVSRPRVISPWLPPATFGDRFNTAADEFDPAMSSDGTEFYFARTDSTGKADVFVSRLEYGAWTDPVKVEELATIHDEVSPRVTGDGKHLLFVSDRPGGVGQYDVWASRRIGNRWSEPFNLGPDVNSARDDYSPTVTADGKRLYFSSNREARGGDEWGGKLRRSAVNNFDLYAAEASDGPTLWFDRVSAVAGVNTPFHEGPASLSTDGLWIYFSSNRPGGVGGFDVYRARLVGKDASAVENLGAGVNSAADDADPQPTADSSQLLFASNREGTRGEDDLFMSRARPPAPPPMDLGKKLPKLGPSGWVLAVTLVLLIPLLNALRSPEARDLLSKCILLSLLLHVLLAMSLSAVQVSKGIIAYVSDEDGEGGGQTMEVPLNLEASRVAELQLRVRNQLTETPAPTAAVELPKMQTDVEVAIEPPPTLSVETASARTVDPGTMLIRAATPEPPAALPVDTVAVTPPTVEMVLPEVRVNLPTPVRSEEVRAELEPNRPVANRVENRMEVAPAAQAALGTVPVRPQYEVAGGVGVATAPPAALSDVPAPEAVANNVAPTLPPLSIEPRVELPRVAVAPTATPPPTTSPARAIARLPTRGTPARSETPDALRPTETRLPVDPVKEAGAGALDAGMARGVGDAVDRPAPQVAVTPLVGRIGPDFSAARQETLTQRAPEERRTLVEQMGGSKESEAAVTRSLEWLAKNQEPDGRWTVIAGNSRARRSETHRHDPALTGLAVLCFLASDHTPTKRGPYQENVRKGLEVLLRTQTRDGDLRGRGNMYNHGIATIAVGEAAMMTGDERYKRAALSAANFTVRAQREDTGGWQYHPGDFGDTSVVAWQMMALHSAERVGFETPQRTYQAAANWLERVRGGRFGLLAGYQNNVPTASMTAQGLLCRVLMNQTLPSEALREATEFVAAMPPGTEAEANFYFWYCGSLSLMQFQNDAWTRWNLKTRDHVVKLQRRGGDADGSFDPDPRWTNQGGRVCSTAFATLTLEVYYRYLPMYAGRARR